MEKEIGISFKIDMKKFSVLFPQCFEIKIEGYDEDGEDILSPDSISALAFTLITDGMTVIADELNNQEIRSDMLIDFIYYTELKKVCEIEKVNQFLKCMNIAVKAKDEMLEEIQRNNAKKSMH